MVRLSIFVGALVASTAFAAPAPARADECDALVGRFNTAVDTGKDSDARKIVDQIATDAACGRFQVAVQRRLSAFQLNAAQDLMARGRPTQEYDEVLVEAAGPGVLWQATATLAEVRFGERRFAEAAAGFDGAIEIVKNETATPTVPSPFEIQGLVDRAAQARILAANATSHAPGTFVAAATDRRDGKLGGVYSPSVRGIVPHALPLSITFDFDRAAMTDIGQEAAQELASVIQEQQPAKIILIGHTDVRGGPDHNMKLSEERAQAVATFLRSKGIITSVEASGVGAAEPLKVDDSAGLTQDDIYALNRRVEWRRE